MTHALALAAALLPLLFQAKDNPEFTYWSEHKTGSWVKLKMEMEAQGAKVVVETHHDFWATPGDVLGLYFNPARTHIFDTETGDRLTWSLASTPPAQSRPLSPATSSS